MKIVIAIAIVVLSSGCTIAPVSNFHVNVVCNKNIIQRNGISIENTHHAKCNKDYPLSFTYTFGVH